MPALERDCRTQREPPLLNFVRRAPLLVCESAEFALNKRVNISVHDRLDVTGLDTDPMILHHLVRLEDV